MLELNPSNVAWWQWAAGALMTLLTGLVAFIIRGLGKEKDKSDASIAAVASAVHDVATREELKRVDLIASDAVRRTEFDQNRREQREDINALHRKIDEMSRECRDGQAAIMSALLELKRA